MPATRRARSPGFGRWLGYAGAVFATAWLATQLFYFAQIAAWNVVNPRSTAFMRSDAARLARERPDLAIQRTWVPYDQISRNLKRAIIASEDANFANNSGYETDAILQAWERNRARGHIVRGGSTITQQLARNLFLSRERSYIRKAQELIITWMLETLLDKERIFEIYLNSVEWGNGVYGAEAAARYYFHTPAAKLSAGQAARLAVMLPQPRYFDEHRGSPYLAQRAAVIARRMGAAELPQ
ncbi:monofunctional biosynthetic peptidoglycan transglycosylase [Paraburkholderia caballeronis]|uniref:Biosynthetic peptidoglycan transglycosylase n=1 Tax=Paraburkholderia caballeronis TaxID=416943 RepID=A0A1H7PZE8_9BURK|nr:monofunctional biosynthetic peptidoglycan transglycosylase [Paraburkholderia caballeronis]PXW24407.1 monofunctional biosynthetic peptidoglycan transglycosylase [Paraburkholderia caballeronis]PXX00189.1 monofunctional biosynthetic peptidoglycan transglycosylase [Paraburkholderia caballeronis]RAJ97318.1 monofunctional biosynthetic peptidoglycan transglycosylase [Paraburkholderia caballeronis]TDV35066.1 monofunctional biosynthetic peptidoglycan transglycosylase [Paraburkholderia caballeronis]S